MTAREFNQPERFRDEPFKDYQERRKQANANTKRELKGKLFWNSEKSGTYRKSDYE